MQSETVRAGGFVSRPILAAARRPFILSAVASEPQTSRMSCPRKDVAAFVGAALAGVAVGQPRHSVCGARPSPSKVGTRAGADAVCMGLNAKSLAKGKKGGKGGKKGGKKGGGGGAAKDASVDRVAQSKGVDTNKREYIFQMQGVGKTLANGKKVLDNINLSFFPKVRIGLLGANGAGKSTLLKIMAGVDKEFDGIAAPQANAKIGYLPQMPTLPGETVGDAIDEAVAETRALLTRFNELSAMVGDDALDDDEKERLGNEWARVQDEIEACNGWELDRNVDRALDALRCPPVDAKHAVLSGGEKRRVALCALLLKSCDLLILDEPTNHLDAESVLWLERFLETFPGTVVAVTHDRFFLENLTQWILSIENGKGVPYEGCYSDYLDARAKSLAEKEKQESSLRRQINSELDWIRASPKARQSKAKARISRFDELVEEQTRFNNDRGSVLDRIYIPPGPSLGDIVVEAQNVGKNYGDRSLYKDLSFSIPKGSIVGCIGPNGSGKSTLLRMIVGEEKPDAGELTVGQTVKIMYASQDRDALDKDKTVFDAISGGSDEMQLGGRTVKSRAYLSWFNFRGAAQQKKVGDLSGGELSRLNLARVTCEGGNLLLLDEITNDADTEYIVAIEQAVLEFAGTVIVVSHDRAFLDHICSHILAFDEEGRSTFFYGNFSAFEEDKRKRLGDTTPSRMKFQALPTL